ncbi:aspartate aminotransferase/aromatic-amino-acid transaminase [Maritalea mobilis]|uniref:Aminotransferase n=1 Tax=Maritalea mobilis TaxID=483324 RepID=A0A4R6VP87_9HYPH|nr:amino acid aminotransferase [Maritalea mobilis]TDQ64040.1 aspartate aminotransferase/aromatic-amino-acid transaminase [Maritalea mobilis]
MFETLKPAPQDKIIALIAEYAADERDSKIDLGVGVYKDATGNTPIMTAVAKAEDRRVKEQTTKTYVGMAGNVGFNNAMIDLVLGDSISRDRVRGAQAPGGTGALRLIADLLDVAKPGATVYLSDPTWPNHVPLMQAAGLKTATYPYFDAETGKVKFDELCAALEKMTADDIVLLHGCCHNPTGANLTNEQWDKVTEIVAKTGTFVLVDIAYLGFGDGLEADAYGVRKLASTLPEMAVAASCSKNFGLYRERVGCAMIIGANEEVANITFSQLLSAARANYSMPPDHGAEIVRIILNDDTLRKEWEEELSQVRNHMVTIREKLAEAMRQRSNSADFDFLAEHRGMFSLLGISQDKVEQLKKDFGVYMVGNSRMNIAGLGVDKIDQFADALVKVTREG